MNPDNDAFRVETKGQDIVATTYWSPPKARAGCMYLSFEAGAVRVLVPDAPRNLLGELPPVGTPITLQLAQWQGQNMWRVSLFDGSRDPYVLDIDRGEADHSFMAAYAGRTVPLIWYLPGMGASESVLDREGEAVVEVRRETVKLLAGELDA